MPMNRSSNCIMYICFKCQYTAFSTSNLVAKVTLSRFPCCARKRPADGILKDDANQRTRTAACPQDVEKRRQVRPHHIVAHHILASTSPTEPSAATVAGFVASVPTVRGLSPPSCYQPQWSLTVCSITTANLAAGVILTPAAPTGAPTNLVHSNRLLAPARAARLPFSSPSFANPPQPQRVANTPT